MFEVVAAESAVHVEQIAGDGDLGDRRRQLALVDDEARGAAAIVAGDRIDALADQLGDVEPVPTSRDQLLGARRPGSRWTLVAPTPGAPPMPRVAWPLAPARAAGPRRR